MADNRLTREFHIPDPDQPIPEEKRGLGPSGVLKPFKPAPVRAYEVVGRRVEEIGTHLGTYGTGGYGFFGIRLDDQWLTIAIDGAGEWILIDGTLIEDTFYDDYGRPEPWIRWEAGQLFDRLSPRLVGSTIKKLNIKPRSLKIDFSNGMAATILDCPDYRPVFEGTKEPRIFVSGDDLRHVVFLSPTAEIWVD